MSSDLQQTALSRLLRNLWVPFATLRETGIRNRPFISIGDYTIYCSNDDDEKKISCAIAVRNDYANMMNEVGSTQLRCDFLRLRDHRGRIFWFVCAHASTETAEENNKDAFYDEDNALMSRIPSQQLTIVGIDANAKMGREQKFDLLDKWCFPVKHTSDNR
ncbi:hypothetical protein RB195_024438 [Necator americanus]|uniref:Uncharacterized protein n=1 Tax=Necator americanus TaxID=51031 RepID=A0ABR1ENB6_NECAM